ncbi:hypothetical protein [Streptomyces narbonensis]|uniref:hypothetical protein n=1 Tax=Streptomyces narbonensis TaxID=67333 RepID=UPI0033CA6129
MRLKDEQKVVVLVAGWYSIDTQLEMTDTYNAGIRSEIRAWRSANGATDVLFKEVYAANAGHTQKSARMTLAKVYLHQYDEIGVWAKVSVSGTNAMFTANGWMNVKFLNK